MTRHTTGGNTMAAGIFVTNERGMLVRPKSKKQVRDAVAADPFSVVVENTSFFGDGFSGPVGNLRERDTITFVGPDPYTARNFFGNITRGPKGLKVT